MQADLSKALAASRSWRWALAAAFFVVAAAASWPLLFRSRPPDSHPLSPPSPPPLSAKPAAGLSGAGLRRESLSWWLQRIAAEAGLGLMVAPGLEGRLAAVAWAKEEGPWRESLAAFSRVYGFDYRINPFYLEVEPPGGSRAGRRRGQGEDSEAEQESGAAVAKVAETGLVKVLRLRSARAVELEPVVSAALEGRGLVLASDPVSNSLVAVGGDALLDDAERLIETLDVEPRRMLLEARIVEISRSAREELGVEWSLAANVGAEVDFPQASGGEQSGAITLATSGARALEARIGAMEASGKVHVVSRPRIVTVAGAEASIESVRILRVRFPDRLSLTDDSRSPGLGARAVESIAVGVTMNVTAFVLSGGRMRLRIQAESSTLGPPQPPDGIPEEISRKVEAEVLLDDGETVVLGGLMKDGHRRSGAGVPLLRDLPVLGRLFGRSSRGHEGEELVIMVTPKLFDREPDG